MKKLLSLFLAFVMALGILPAGAFAAGTAANDPPAGSFELDAAGTTAWNGGDDPLAVYAAETGTAQAATIPAGEPFALLENGNTRLKIGYCEGGWTGDTLESTGWVDKDSILVNLPDLIPSIAYIREDAEAQFNSRLTRFEYVIPCPYGEAERLAQLQAEAMAGGETLLLRMVDQIVTVSRATGGPASLETYSLDGATYQKYSKWTEVEPADNGISAYQLPYNITTAYSADPSVTLGMFAPQDPAPRPNRAPAANAIPTGDVGAYNPGSPGGRKPSTTDVAWTINPERTFLRFTLVEFPGGVVTDLNTQDWNTWHVVGTPLNVVWGDGWSAEKCRSDITWYNSNALQYLEALLTAQAKSPKRYPLTAADRKKLLPSVVNSGAGQITVSIPDEDTRTFGRRGTETEHIQIQAALAKIGESMGFRLWIPSGDRQRVLELWRPVADHVLLTHLPLNYDNVTLRIIENIDILWIRRNAVVRAFEVEHSTSIYSGLLRMADLMSLQPNLKIKAHIVAPSARRGKVLQEISRPVFALMESGPMSESCSYLSYDAIRELSGEKNLPHLSDSVLDDYAEFAQESDF